MFTVRKFASIVMLLATSLLWIIPSSAQTNGQIEVVGIVEGMTFETITLNDLEIDITSAAINVPISLGIIVEVEGTLALDGSVAAQEVNAVDTNMTVSEAELIGRLESFNGNTMNIGGQLVDVSTAEVATDVTVNTFVKAHAIMTNTTTWVAREVTAFVPDATNINDEPLGIGEFEIIGTLENIEDDAVVVAGQRILLVDTEIRDTLVVGVRVQVHLRMNNGNLVANEIQHAFTNDDGDNNSNINNNSNSNLNGNNNANSNSNSNSNNNANNNQNANGEPTISADQAIAIVLSVYPSTTVTEIELKTKFGGRLVWEIETSHDIHLDIDAQTGAILSITRGDSNSNGNINNNANSNNNTNANNNFNANGNNNGNSNDNDDGGNSNNNSNRNDDDDDDNNSNDNDDDDDNSGSGSRDDDDDDD